MLTDSHQTTRSPARQRLLLVTGLLGAGKTTVLRELEDRGWETIDNFPVRLLDRLIDDPRTRAGENRPPLVLGFDSRTRGFNPDEIMAAGRAACRPS